MIHNFKTGKLGLSDPEIKKERQDIFEAINYPRAKDP